MMNHASHEGVITKAATGAFERCRECNLKAIGSRFTVYDERNNALSFSAPQIIYDGPDAAKAIRASRSLYGRGSIRVL